MPEDPPGFREEELQIEEIEEILNYLDTNDGSHKALIKSFRDNFERMKRDGEAKYIEQRSYYAGALKNRFFNLVDAIEHNSGIKFPDQIKGVPVLNNEALSFLLPRERRLVVANTIRTKFLGMNRERYDFPLAVEADDDVSIRSMLACDLLSSFPSVLRKKIQSSLEEV
jgi:hypothetical protein